LRADVTVRDPNQRDHRFQFRVGAIQGMAKIQYRGLANLELRYEARDSQTGLEWSEKFWGDKKIVLGHYKNPQEDLSALALRFHF
jgi:hypothetical protein